MDEFDDVHCDIALAGDPHVVGVALLLGESQDEYIEDRRIRQRRRDRSQRQGNINGKQAKRTAERKGEERSGSR